MYEIDRNEIVEAWVKNDHLGLEIQYLWEGQVRKYRPDFLMKLRNGTNFIFEVKGIDSQQNKTKRRFLDEWVRAVNSHGGFGTWKWDVSRNPMDLEGILNKAVGAER